MQVIIRYDMGMVISSPAPNVATANSTLTHMMSSTVTR